MTIAVEVVCGGVWADLSGTRCPWPVGVESS